MFIPSGAAYVDYAIEDQLAGSSTPILINNYPHNGQTSVPAADGLGSTPLYLTVVDIGTDGLSAGDTHVFVTTADEGLIEVFDGTNFHANWSNSTYVPAMSAGSGVVDEHRFVLIRDTPFESEDVVIVRVMAETTTADTLDTTYAFIIEDLTKPLLVSAETRGLLNLIVVFNEPMLQLGDDALGDSLRVRDISGGAEVIAPLGLNPPRILMSRDVFSADDVGMYIGIANADNSVNNDIFEIVSYISAREVEIDSTEILDEELPDDAIITISPYKVNGVPDEALVIPYFNPLVVAAEAIDESSINLTLHTEITQNRLYTFFAKLVTDVPGNFIDPATVEFTTEPCGAPVDRDFSIEEMVPQENLNQDSSRDLIRFLRVANEVWQLILCSVDNFTNILDIDLIPAKNLDAMLAHLGVPFSFAGSLSTVDKRRLASIAVEMYKRKGGEVAIEAIVNFILGIEIDIHPYSSAPNIWVLGVSELGVNTLLGPGTSFLRYSFEVETFQDLTTLERERLIEIVEYMKPAHTHFIRIVEPTTPPVTVFNPWILGVDLLGESTILG